MRFFALRGWSFVAVKFFSSLLKVVAAGGAQNPP
jgi:hypothetical protein